MSLATTVADAIKKVNDLMDLVKGQYNKWDGQVKAKIAELESWKINVIQKKSMATELGVFRPIVKFNSSGLVSSFRMIISGTNGNFVYGGIFDFVGHHPGKFNLVNVASSNYGNITLKISINYLGNGFIELKKNSGDGGVHNLSVSLIPYSGTIVHSSNKVIVDDTYTVTELNYENGKVA